MVLFGFWCSTMGAIGSSLRQARFGTLCRRLAPSVNSRHSPDLRMLKGIPHAPATLLIALRRVVLLIDRKKRILSHTLNSWPVSRENRTPLPPVEAIELPLTSNTP